MNSIKIPREDGDIEVKLPTPKTYIYRFTSPHGKSYIGQTKDVPRRLIEHLEGNGSKALLKDLVEFGRKSFTIQILEVLYDDHQTLANQREDWHIEHLDCLSPKGYNLRLNRNIVPESIIPDLNSIKITAKHTYVGKDGFTYFSIPEFTQSRSYQILMNLGKKRNLTQKKLGTFNYYELKTIADSNLVPQKIYKLSMAYKNGFRLIECDGS